jgi:hypothetical protein
MSSTFNIENTTLDNYIKEEKKKKASNRRDAQNKV